MITEEKVLKMQRSINRSIKQLNAGGCIHFAYYFSKALKEAKISHKVVFSNSDPADVRYNYFTTVYHVMIFIPGIGYIDGYDLYPTKSLYASTYKEERCIKKFDVSVKKLDYFRSAFQWNPTYPTKQNEKLEQIIQKHINGSGKHIRKKG